jgi:hypothetical protein
VPLAAVTGKFPRPLRAAATAATTRWSASRTLPCRRPPPKRSRRCGPASIEAAASRRATSPHAGGGRRQLRLAAAAAERSEPPVAGVIRTIADQLEAGSDLPPAMLEERLSALESVLLAACWRTLPRPSGAHRARQRRCRRGVGRGRRRPRPHLPPGDPRP